MGAKEAQNYFAPIFPKNGRIMHFAPGRRAQGAFYPRPRWKVVVWGCFLFSQFPGLRLVGVILFWFFLGSNVAKV